MFSSILRPKRIRGAQSHQLKAHTMPQELNIGVLCKAVERVAKGPESDALRKTRYLRMSKLSQWEASV